MKVGEIPVNATIQVRVVKGDQKFECMGVVVATREDGLYLTPLKYRGQILDFSSDSIQIFLFYVSPERQAFGWSTCRIRKDIYQRKLCHLLTTKKESVRVNRRKEPRIRTDLQAKLRTLSDDEEHDIVIRNYSKGGVGFLSKKSISEHDWAATKLVYDDAQLQQRFVLRLNILHRRELPNGLIRYGACIPQADTAWIRYVEQKLTAIRERDQETEAENSEA